MWKGLTRRPRAIRRNLDDRLPIRVADVDIPVGIDGRARRRRRHRERLRVLREHAGEGGVVEGLVEVLGFDARHAALAGLVVVVFAVGRDFVLVGVDVEVAARGAVEESAFARDGHEAFGRWVIFQQAPAFAAGEVENDERGGARVGYVGEVCGRVEADVVD